MAKISPEKREAILDAIRAGGTRNAIARDHDVSVGSVTNIAKAANLTDAFDRSATKNATAAVVADNKARRARIAEKFLQRAEELLDAMDKPHIVFSFGGRDNVFNSKELARPPVSDIRSMMTAAAVAVDKSVVIEKHDDDAQGLAAVDAWLRDIVGGGS